MTAHAVLKGNTRLLQNGCTWLFWAIANGQSQELVGQLLAAGADVNAANKVRRTLAASCIVPHCCMCH
jgi:ankyrin repeat protein